MQERAEDPRFQDPENQMVPLRKWVEAQGWSVYKEYVDFASGADPGRPEFRSMMRDAGLLRFRSILVWKSDRFSREGASQVLAYIMRLKRRRISLRSLTESWLDTSSDNPYNELILAVMSWAAGEERRKISERTRAGIARRRAIGQWKGGRPKGSRDKKPRKKGGRVNDRGGIML